MYPANIGTVSISAVSLKIRSKIKSVISINALISDNMYFLLIRNAKNTVIPIVPENASEPMQ